jgi:signal transduction protein with GAF and PtsI domain
LKVPRRKDNQPWKVIFLFIIAVGFFLPLSAKGWLIIILKIFLFVLFIIYGFINQNTVSRTIHKKEHDEFSDDSILGTKSEWSGFDEAFRVFYQRFLKIIRNAMVATYTGFYLKKSTDRFKLQAGEDEHGKVNISESVENNNLIGYVASQKKPILEGNLPAGTTIEEISQSEIRSFLGVPLILEEDVIGILVTASKVEGSFGEEDLRLMIHFSELLIQVMEVYYRGLRKEIDQEIYRVHLTLIQMLKNNEDEESVICDFVKQLKMLFLFDRFTLCVKEGNEGVIHYVHGQIDDLAKGIHFPLDDGLNGWIIRRNTSLYITDLEDGNYDRPRYKRGEDTKHGMHSFLGIPLGSGDNIWGCLSLESKNIGQYGDKEKEILSNLAIHLESRREHILLLRQLQLLEKDGFSSKSVKFEIE